MKRLAWLMALAAGGAWAGEHGLRAAPANATYAEECGSCHVAYPPALLPPDAWKRLMGGLPKHFGSDASLAPAVEASLSTWLQAHAGRRADAPPEDRITKSRWFRHEHDEVPAGAWQRAAIRSPSNCTACHEGAARGDFDEHAVRIPR